MKGMMEWDGPEAGQKLARSQLSVVIAIPIFTVEDEAFHNLLMHWLQTSKWAKFDIYEADNTAPLPELTADGDLQFVDLDVSDEFFLWLYNRDDDSDLYVRFDAHISRSPFNDSLFPKFNRIISGRDVYIIILERAYSADFAQKMKQKYKDT